MSQKGRKLSARKLTLIFLAVIMAMSIIFSSVFYITSVHELDKRPAGDTSITPPNDPDHTLDEWIGRRSDDSKVSLGQHLIILNLSALLIGAIVSYWLARVALRPIEKALNEQDRFISDASHELRTPIATVLISNEVALKNTKLTLKEAKQVLKDNVTDMRELKSLTDELLDQTKAERIDESSRVTDISTLIKDVIAKFNSVSKQKNIEIQYEPDNAKFLTYPTSLAKVLSILLDNALKYSPEGSTIHITSSAVDDGIAITVKDEGIGISKSDQEHIFDRFYRSDMSRSKHEGYGLGLSIAKNLVKEMGGTMTVSSTLHVGSEFTVKLNKISQK